MRAAGGNYYDVRDAEQLGKAYVEIDRLEKGTYLTKAQVACPAITHLPWHLLALLGASIGLRAIRISSRFLKLRDCEWPRTLRSAVGTLVDNNPSHLLIRRR